MDYSTHSKNDLLALADERGIEVAGRTSKTKLIAMLEASDQAPSPRAVKPPATDRHHRRYPEAADET